jgi:hypoxanthine phosphoribosyltransferase
LLLGRKNTLSSEVEFEIPTWEQIYESLLNLADRVRKANFKLDVIVGVSRGGWPPARIMSDLLENPELANVKAEFYLGVAKTKGEPMITQPVSTSVTGKKVLVVDEVADTGKSLRLVQSHLKERGATEVKILTVYYKPWSVVIPDWYGKETSRWIIFPWERKENVRQILKEYKTRGEPIEGAVNKLVLSGLNRKLLERFIKEISEGQS